MRGFEVNRLTVIATESYEQFAENLQKEIEADTGIRFGILEPHQFAAIAVIDATAADDGTLAPLGGVAQSKAFVETCWPMITSTPKARQDSLKLALKEAPGAATGLCAQRGQIVEVLRKVAGRWKWNNADDPPRSTAQGRDGKSVYLSEDFKALWDRIKHQTTYRVQRLTMPSCCATALAALKKAPAIAKARLQWRKADISIGKAGVEATETQVASVVLDESDIEAAGFADRFKKPHPTDARHHHPDRHGAARRVQAQTCSSSLS